LRARNGRRLVWLEVQLLPEIQEIPDHDLQPITTIKDLPLGLAHKPASNKIQELILFLKQYYRYTLVKFKIQTNDFKSQVYL
jgi:hypothetical protein